MRGKAWGTVMFRRGIVTMPLFNGPIEVVDSYSSYTISIDMY